MVTWPFGVLASWCRGNGVVDVVDSVDVVDVADFVDVVDSVDFVVDVADAVDVVDVADVADAADVFDRACRDSPVVCSLSSQGLTCNAVSVEGKAASIREM